jgi:hypothetical protein
MRVLVGRKSDKGRFAAEPPVAGAEIVEWTEPRSGGIRLVGPGVPGARHDVPTARRAWALEVGSMEDFLAALTGWRGDCAASVEVEARDRGRSGESDMVVTLLDYDGDEFVSARVVD